MPLDLIPKPSNPLSSSVLLAYGFAGLIILGTILLVLPVSSSTGQFTSPINALFTSVSAVCVTGLTVVDTGTFWSPFGRGVIFGLFQIGGFGFIIGATLLLLAIGGRFGLRDRLLISESMGEDHLGGILGMVWRVALFTIVIEGIGAIIFYFHWIASGNTGTSFFTALFHAGSSFNNCGMDIFGNSQSLASFQNDWVTIIVTAILILFGSVSYIVIADFFRVWSFRKLSLNSKIVLVTTFALLALGTIFYLVMESGNQSTLGAFPFPQKILLAFFQTVTPRTAGFSAIDIGSLQQITLFFTMFLMFIGGAVGSTAGGIKVNNLGILAVTFIRVIQGQENISAFGRQISRQTIFRALVIIFLYLLVASLVVILLSLTEIFPFEKILFETFSALSTVGLSTGITPALSIAGKVIIVIAMFIGRLGPLALMAFMVHHQNNSDVEYPYETIRLG